MADRKPRPKCLYRDPKSQNEHAWALIHARDLTMTQVAIGMAMHYLAYADGKPNLSPSRRMTPEFIAGHAAWTSPKTIQANVGELVRRGYFVRLDNGNGGYKKGNADNGGYGAVYRPVVPDNTA